MVSFGETEPRSFLFGLVPGTDRVTTPCDPWRRLRLAPRLDKAIRIVNRLVRQANGKLSHPAHATVAYRPSHCEQSPSVKLSVHVAPSPEELSRVGEQIQPPQPMPTKHFRCCLGSPKGHSSRHPSHAVRRDWQPSRLGRHTSCLHESPRAPRLLTRSLPV